MQADYRALILNPCFKINLSLLKDILSLSMIASIQFITTVLVCLFPCFFFPNWLCVELWGMTCNPEGSVFRYQKGEDTWARDLGPGPGPLSQVPMTLGESQNHAPTRAAAGPTGILTLKFWGCLSCLGLPSALIYDFHSESAPPHPDLGVIPPPPQGLGGLGILLYKSLWNPTAEDRGLA